MGGACLGPATNNVVEYNVVIELLRDDIVHGITFLEVRIDSQLVVSQLNGVYQVRHPTLLRQFFLLGYLKEILNILYTIIFQGTKTQLLVHMLIIY